MGQPRVPLHPQPPPALPADDQRAGGAMRVEQDRARAVLLDVGQGRLPDLVVGDGHADERVGVQRELDVRRRDRIHEPGLLLDAGVLVDIAQLDDRPVIARRPHAGEVDIGEGRQQFLDRLLVLPPDVDDRVDPVVGVEQCRQRGDGVEGAAVLLEDLATMGDDAITRDGPEYRDATACRHDHPPDFSTRVSDLEQLDWASSTPVRPTVTWMRSSRCWTQRWSSAPTGARYPQAPPGPSGPRAVAEAGAGLRTTRPIRTARAGERHRRGRAPSGTTFVTIREGACRCLQWSMSRATRMVAWGPIIRSSGVISRAGAVRGTRHLAIPRRAGPNRWSSPTSLAESAGRQAATSVTSPPRAPGRCHKRSRILLAGAITCVGPGSSPMDDRSLR